MLSTRLKGKYASHCVFVAPSSPTYNYGYAVEKTEYLKMQVKEWPSEGM